MPGMPPPEGERHSHDYRLDVVVRRDDLDERGMVVDLDLLDKALRDAAVQVADADLENVVDAEAVTVEVFARWLHGELAGALGPLPGVDSRRPRLGERDRVRGLHRAPLSRGTSSSSYAARHRCAHASQVNRSSTRSRPRAPIRAASARFPSSSARRSRSSSTSPGVTRNPVSPSRTTSGSPSRRLAITGVPLAIASSTLSPSSSEIGDVPAVAVVLDGRQHEDRRAAMELGQVRVGHRAGEDDVPAAGEPAQQHRVVPLGRAARRGHPCRPR